MKNHFQILKPSPLKDGDSTFCRTNYLIAAFSFFIFNFALTCSAQPAYTWANSIGNTGVETGRSIAVDGSGNVYIIGYFSGTVDFDPSGVTNNLSAASQDIFVAKYTSAGAYLWAFKISGGSSESKYYIAIDGSGNVHISGYFAGTADFDPSGVTNNLTSAGSDDIFVAKYTSAGAYLWAFKIGSIKKDQGAGIAVDGSGNVFVTGYFGGFGGGTADFDPSGTTVNLTSAGDADIFVAKYTSAGAYLWAFRIGSSASDLGFGIAVDGSANVYVTGYFQSTADFDPSGVTNNLTSAAGEQDIFVAKYNSAGAYQWAFDIGGAASNGMGSGIATDGSANVYVTGNFRNTADFNPDPGTTNNLTSAGADDIFVAKYNSVGAYQWAFNVGAASTDISWSIATDGSANVYVTGYFQSTADFNPDPGTTNNLTSAGGLEIFVAQYTSDGTYLCAGRMGGTANDIGFGIAVDGSGNIFVTGGFVSAPADFDPGAGTANLSSAGSFDTFFAKYGGCGTPLPIELLSFTAAAENNNLVRCKWATASELNNDYFGIERSQDGISFAQIATAPSKAPGGNSSLTLLYEFADEFPYTGLSYYRLRQVDFNGTFTYSEIRTVYIGTISIISIYPNPSSDYIQYLVGSETGGAVRVRLYDALGREVLDKEETIEAGVTIRKLNTANLSNGNYLLKITNGNLEKTQRQFVVK